MTRLTKRHEQSLADSWARVLTPPYTLDRHHDAIDLMLDGVDAAICMQQALAEIAALLLLANLPRGMR